MVLFENILYVGGAFTHVQGQPRNCLAAIDLSIGQVTEWNPNVNSDVNAMERLDGKLYFGGKFTSVGGETRKHLAAVDLITGLPTSWKPASDEWINALIVANNHVIAGGTGGFLAVYPPIKKAELKNPRTTLNQFSFRLEGEDGRDYVIEDSINLISWAPVSTNTTSAGAFEFSQLISSASRTRFYRAYLKD